MNSFELPVWIRPYGFRLYAYVFGCNLEEIDPDDLTQYASLGQFFYRKLKPGARPIDNAILVRFYLYLRTSVLPILQVSPADGTVIHLGTIENLRVEQVKGITYSLDALLGVDRSDPESPTSTVIEFPDREMSHVTDQEFANVNGIEYSLDQLLGASTPSTSGSATPPTPRTQSAPEAESLSVPKKFGEQIDASVEHPGSLQETIAHDASVAREIGLRPSIERKRSTSGTSVKEGNALYFTVIYLAPGDYHRFHSPTAWVVEKRRHFVGESSCTYFTYRSSHVASRRTLLRFPVDGKAATKPLRPE